MNNRKILAETLREYERIIQINEEEYTDSDAVTRAIIERNINLIGANREAVKRFARQIGIISYEENYDMTTQELIEILEIE